MVAMFGVMATMHEDIGQYYLNHTASCINGMSGGPVVILDRPDTLAGIVMGARSGGTTSIFLRADCPVIQKAYDHYVLKSSSSFKEQNYNVLNLLRRGS